MNCDSIDLKISNFYNRMNMDYCKKNKIIEIRYYKSIVDTQFGPCIIFENNFNEKEYLLPDDTYKLGFGHTFNQNVDNLPNNIHTLQFGHIFNQNVDNLPNSIHTLNFGIYFNKNVDNLPNSIHTLQFGYSFNQKVDNLPNSIHTLQFGFFFNKNVNKLPNSIVSLSFGNNFNKCILNLPKSIKSIYFDKCFNYPLILQNNVSYIRICIANKTKKHVYNYIKNSLRIMKMNIISENFNCEYLKKFPFNLRFLMTEKIPKNTNFKKIPYSMLKTMSY